MVLAKRINSRENKLLLEIGEPLNLKEIEEAFSRFKVCPKCGSKEGFWLGLKGSHVHVQCKSCGAKFELHEVYAISEKGKASERLKFFRK